MPEGDDATGKAPVLEYVFDRAIVLLEDILQLVGERWGDAVMTSDKPYVPLWVEDYARLFASGKVLIYENAAAYEDWQDVEGETSSIARITWTPDSLTVAASGELGELVGQLHAEATDATHT
jgi:hypothetical protein